MSELKQMIDYDFRGGLNTDKSPDKLANNELTETENVVLDERGSIKTRTGTSVINSNGYDRKVVQIMEWPRANGTTTFLATFGDNILYKIAKNSGERTQIKTINNERLAYFNFRDAFYFLDGDNLYKYDGQNVTEVVNTGTILTVSNDYQTDSLPEHRYDPYRVVFDLDKINIVEGSLYIKAGMAIDGNGNPAPGLDKDSAINDDVNYPDYYWVDDYQSWSETETDHNGYVEGVDYDIHHQKGEVVAYEYKQQETLDIGLLYQRFCFAQDGSYGDWYLSYDYDSDPPNSTQIKKCKYALKHSKSRRCFYAGNPEQQQALYYSKYDQPADVSAEDVVFPTENEGPITGMIEFVDYVLVFYRHSVWVWGGIDPETDAVWEKIPAPQGAYSQDTIKLTPNSVTYLGPGGLYVLTPAVLGKPTELESSGVKNIAEGKINDIIKDMSYPESSKAVYDSKNNRYLLAYSSDGITYLDKILVFDWNLQAFTIFSGFQVQDFCYTLEEEVLIGCEKSIIKFDQSKSKDNYFSLTDTKTTDSVTTKVATKEYIFKAPFKNKFIKKIYSSVANIDNNIDYFDYYLNLVNNTGTEEINVWYPSYEYEKTIGENDIETVNYNEKCNKLQLKITSDQAIKISGFKIEYKLINTVGDIV